MTRNDFLSCAPLLKSITNRKKTIDGRKINWLNIQNIIYRRGEPLLLHIREYDTCDNPPFTIRLQKLRGPRLFTNINLEPLYTNHRPITRKKYNDLIQLLKFVPDKYHAFYKSLKFVDDTDNDFSLALRQSDDEDEYDE